jgi:predicted site-specific integrase-resolvase
MADRLGVQRDTVHKWRYRGVLPEPMVVLSGTPIWEWDEIAAWAEKRKGVTPSE